MIKRFWILFVTNIFILSAVVAQNDDPVLFSVEDDPVHVSEFTYIYSKTNGDKADFSKKSLEEYLDLYTKFKLKVQKAKEMRLDTIEQLNKELAGYRRQLADSYLIDKEVTEKLIREAYDRIRQDVDISHILFSVNEGRTQEAYQKALVVKKQLDAGEDFSRLAQQFSTDPSAAKNGGRIGYITAVLPNGFYALETAAYNQEVGAIGGPILTNAGYHLLKVNGRRPARGEIEVAHILIRNKEGREPTEVKQRIDSIYQALQNGADFEQLAKDLSEDRLSAQQGGYIGFFGINRYEKAFEDAAFRLTEDATLTPPFESSVGWHVIKRISKRDIQPYEVEKSRLENKIKSDPRFEIAKAGMIERIKRNAKFKAYPDVLDKFIASESDTFLTFRWRPPEPRPQETLIELGGEKFSLGDFMAYVRGDASRKRLSMGRTTELETAIKSLYKDYVDASCLKYEERQLEKKYPDFKNLMREYEEGILLFEATKMLVWDKASQDSVGLAAFFDKNSGLYRWEERARMSLYRLSGNDRPQLETIRAYAENHSREEVLAKFNTDEKIVLAGEERTMERTRARMLGRLPWRVGGMSDNKPENRGSIYSFYKIEELLPAGPKTLSEARGYVVADYQDFLEEQWVEELRKEYRVKLNKKVFEGLVKN